MEKYYKISGLVLRLEGQRLTDEEKRWKAFACNKNAADLTCRVCYVENLQKPEFAERRGNVLLTPEGRVHLASKNGEPYARVREEDHALTVEIPRSFFPWGQNVEELFEVLALPHLLLPYKRLLLHGAYINYCGQGLFFTGPSSIGKTTQARLWQKTFGANPVNEDRAIISAATEDVKIHGVPVAGSSPVCENRTLPLKAIIVLGQGSENTLERLRPTLAGARLMDGTYQLPAFRGDVPAACNLALDIVSAVPVYRLICRPEPEAARLLHHTLFA